MAVSMLTYALALTAAVLAGVTVQAVAGVVHPLIVVAIADAVATAVVFAASVVCDNSSLYDPYWSLQPPAIALYCAWPALAQAEGSSALDARGVVVLALVCLYGLRLTSNFYRDWPGLGKEDFRYVGFRRRSGRLYWLVSFFGIHFFPTTAVFLGCLPLYAIFAAEPSPLGWLDVLAGLVLFGAVAIAFVADEQLRRFRTAPGNAARSIDSGLWRYSRHPNYLGEVLSWWGLYLFALACSPTWWWTGVGAVAITLLFVFVSVPMMESRALATRQGYAEYARRTPMLLPLGQRATRSGHSAQTQGR